MGVEASPNNRDLAREQLTLAAAAAATQPSPLIRQLAAAEEAHAGRRQSGASQHSRGPDSIGVTFQDPLASTCFRRVPLCLFSEVSKYR